MAAWLGDSGQYDNQTQNFLKPLTSEQFSIKNNTDIKTGNFHKDFDNFELCDLDKQAPESELFSKDDIKENIKGFAT